MSIFWFIYIGMLLLASAAIFILLRKRFSRGKLILCIVLVVIPLLVPFQTASVSEGQQFFAPAWISVVFEQLQGDLDRSRSAISIIILVECIALLLTLFWIFMRGRASKSAA